MIEKMTLRLFEHTIWIFKLTELVLLVGLFVHEGQLMGLQVPEAK